MSLDNSPLPARQAWMGLLAKAPPARLQALLDAHLPALPAHALLRAPETGTVMVEGRSGGTGTPFNLGEMTVTRCTARLDTGQTGHAHVQGRDKGHALRAALVDALMQGPDATALRTAVLDPLAAEAAARARTRAARAAATKVEFFTLVRGED